MPFPWSKSSSKEAKKKSNSSSKDRPEGVLPKLQHLGKKGQRLSSEDDGSIRGSRSSFDSPRLGSSEATSILPSTVGTRTSSFAEHHHHHQQQLAFKIFKAQPLPLPAAKGNNNGHLPLPTYDQVDFRQEPVELDGTTSGYGSGSLSSGSSMSSGETTDVCNASRQFLFLDQNGHGNSFSPQKKRIGRNLRQEPHQKPTLSGSKTNSVSPLRASVPVKEEKAGMHVNLPARSAPTSLFSSPCHSPRRLSSSEQQALFGTHQRMLPEYQGAFSSANQGRLSPERSPLASPMRSPGPSSRIQSGAVSPRHVRGTDSPTLGHRLPPPPPATTSFSNASANSALSPSSAFPSSPISSPSGMAPHIAVIRWQKGNILGSGSFGRVYKGFSDSGTFCAMKEVLLVDDPKSKESVKQLMQEINMLSSLRHPNIVQYLGSEMFEDSLYIYLEFVSGGSIQKVLQEYGAFKEPVIRSYTHQILSGLAYLHSMNKVHRDIKGANILVDTNGEVKLADFGMAKHISSNSLVLSFKGSPYWMAPELFKSSNVSGYPVDIWSLGCTIIEMATGKPPWSEYEGVAAMFKIGNSKEIPYIPESLSPIAQGFIRLCLQRNPEDRPTAAQLLEHPFVKFSYDEHLPDGLPPPSPTFRSVVANLNPDSGSKGPYHTRDPPSHAQSRPLSPIGSPSVHSRSIYSTYGGLTPIITSGTSTPRTAGYDDSPRVLQGFGKERLSVTSRLNGMHIDATRSSVATPGNRSPVANGLHRSDFGWNPPPDASPRRGSNDILGVALPENSRFYTNGPVSERTNSPLRNMDRL